ncbi:phosphoglycerate kinase [Patescibacteria group bacterium]|nr:phosphoglycerate kinase [Patescibacteria group bacterium]MBU1123873.1 phosphoglycerate kinase [Patescibacteria group bacterium]MBU1911391.1 phosphoglycerate kinase [Patescibacteria group bacterium]
MRNYNLLREADLQGKTVFMRAGFDVPYDLAEGEKPEEDQEKGPWVKVTGDKAPDDDTQVEMWARVNNMSRIKAVIDSMRHILREGAALVIAAHQSRPKGKRVAEMSQKPLVPVIEALLDTKVQFADSCVGDETIKMAGELKPGEVLLLENLRYEKGEKKNDPEFAAKLAELADIYVNDAFPNCHREHASVVGITEHLPSYMGIGLQREVEGISAVIEDPKQPITLIVSGAKMETKVPVIESFLPEADDVILGGCIANTFIGAAGGKIGKSKHEPDQFEKARDIMHASCVDGSAKVHIPVDATVAQQPSEEAKTSNVKIDKGVPTRKAIFDIGTETVQSYLEIIRKSGTIIWNGPVGMTEINQFASGSKAIADCTVEATKNGAKSLIGGGDTVEFLERFGYSADLFTHVSMGGGAMLEFTSGNELPALQVLEKKE